MASQLDQSEPAQGDWLTGCTGFTVQDHGAGIGRVAAVKRDADSGRPTALVVRAGIGGMRRLLVPVDEVAGVVPSSRRIVLDGAGPGCREGATPHLVSGDGVTR
jgi:hypothetical protein